MSKLTLTRKNMEQVVIGKKLVTFDYWNSAVAYVGGNRLRIDESVEIADCVITLERIQGKAMKFSFEADRSVTIVRKELLK